MEGPTTKRDLSEKRKSGDWPGAGAHPHKIWGVNSIVGPTFRILIYRYRHNRSQNNFALFAYSNPTDVGTDFLLFIGVFRDRLFVRNCAPLIGGSGGPPENFGIFELPTLDFLQFQHDFSSFSNKKGLLLGGPTPFSGGAITGAGGGRLWPLQYIC